jgi:hypothetical protein
MKSEQKSIGRWVAKLVSKARRSDKQESSAALPELAPEALKQVAGGGGAPSSGPNKGW